MKESLEEFKVTSNDLYDWYIDPLLSIHEDDKIVLKEVLIKIQRKYFITGLQVGLKAANKQLKSSYINSIEKIYKSRLEEMNQ